MDIAALSVSMSQSKIANQASLLVLKKVMDLSQNESINMQKSLEMSVTPHLGQNIDIRL